MTLTKVFLREFAGRNKYAGKILPLLEEPTLGQAPYLNEDRKEYSNCHGTVLYVLDKYGDERPLYVEGESMRPLLTGEVYMEQANVVSFWNKETTREPRHTAILVGVIEDNPIIFHQNNWRGNFEIIGMRDYLKRFSPLDVQYHAVH